MSKVIKKTKSEDITFEFPDVEKKKQKKSAKKSKKQISEETSPKKKVVVEEKKKKLSAYVLAVVAVAVIAGAVVAIVRSVNAPVFSVAVEMVQVCPNGKVLDFEYKVEDKKGNNITESAKVEFKRGMVFISATDERGFYGERAIKANVEDKDAPELKLNGGDEISIIVDDEYEDLGAVAIDKCDGDVQVATDGKVDNTKLGEYEVVYKAIDASGNTAEEKRIVKVIEPVGVIYLTFDDGPSEHTGRLLDVLKENGVKATFFVTGRGDDDLILREYKEGHTIGLHTYTHRYDLIYQNTGTYFDDLYAIRDRVEDITGLESNLIRFPGGSSNTVSALYDGGRHIMSTLVDEVEERGFSYFDWNISSGDAGEAKTSEEVYDNVTDHLGEGTFVVLQHDTEGFSVDAVEDIIKYGKSHGYRFKKLEADSYGAHHWVNN